MLANRNTVEGLTEASRLVPASPEFPRELAYLDLSHRHDLLQRSLALNPFDAAAWIQLGIDDELRRQDVLAAKRDYLSAADVDHMYVPRWTLENFYLRQNDPAEFFRWAKAALSITPYYSYPIYDQIWSVSTNPVFNASLLPNRRRILFEYVGYMLASNRVDLRGAPIFSHVAQQALLTQKSQIADANLMNPNIENQISGGAVDKLLIEGATSQAESLWQTMKTAGLTQLPAPSDEHPVTNPAFETPISGNGFDWSVNQVKGLAIQRVVPVGLRIALDGFEPESFQLLHQFIPVRSGTRYRLTWDMESIDRAPPNGMRWEIHGITAGAISPQNLAQASVSNNAAGPSTEVFDVPPDVKACLISLIYTRPLGETRLEGTFLLKKVAASVVLQKP